MNAKATKTSESNQKQNGQTEPDDNRQAVPDGELDSEQLEAVSGGLSMEITGDTSERPR